MAQAIIGQFFDISTQCRDLAGELNCGWNGFPGGAGISVRFDDKDEDDFEWVLNLTFAPEDGSAFNMSSTLTLTEASLTLFNDNDEIDHNIEVDPYKLTSFAHIAAVILQAREAKPYISPADKAAKAASKLAAKTMEAAKKQMQSMGIKIN